MADYSDHVTVLDPAPTPRADALPTSHSLIVPDELGDAYAKSVRPKKIAQRVWDAGQQRWVYYVDAAPNATPDPAKTDGPHSGALDSLTHEVLYEVPSDLNAYALNADVDTLAQQTAASFAALQAAIDAAVSPAQLTEAIQSVQASTGSATADITAALAAKANTSDVTAALAAKADASALAAKANTSDVNAALAAKADTSALAAKANTSDVNAALAAKADTSALAAKANTSDVNAALAAKADTSALAAKANTSDVSAALAAKADTSALETAIATRAPLKATALLVADGVCLPNQFLLVDLTNSQAGFTVTLSPDWPQDAEATIKMYESNPHGSNVVVSTGGGDKTFFTPSGTSVIYMLNRRGQSLTFRRIGPDFHVYAEHG